MLRAFCVAVSLCGAGLSVSSAAEVNVALGKSVSLVAGSANGASLDTLTDGRFLSRGTQWQSGTVWWSGVVTTFEIDLGGPFSLVGATVQADDNDGYRVWYRDMATGTFEVLWNVPNYDNFGNGMQTRPDPNNDAGIHFFADRVLTDAIRIAAVSGDGANSLSEVAVFIPAPGTGAALLCLGVLRRRRR